MRGRSMCLKLGRGGAEAEARSMIGNKKCSRDAAHCLMQMAILLMQMAILW